MAVWTGPHLYSQTQINHVDLSEVRVLQNSCLITVKGYIAGRMNHDVDSHSSCTFAVWINPDRTAKERRVSCFWREKHRAMMEKPSGTLLMAAGAEGASRHGSVLELSGVHTETRLVVEAGHAWACSGHGSSATLPWWLPNQGGWFCCLKSTSRVKSHCKTAFTWMVWM